MFTVTRTETIRDGIRLTRGEVIELLAYHGDEPASALEALDDAALLEAFQAAYDQGDSLWEEVYTRLESSGWSDVRDSDTHIDVEEGE